MANKEIKHYAESKGIRLWQVAAELGMNDGNFSRKLRFELPEQKKAEIRSIIDELAREEA